MSDSPSGTNAAAGGDFAIIGAGGHGRELLDIVEGLGARDRFRGFIDDTEPTGGAADRVAARNATWLGTVHDLASMTLDYGMGIGTSSVRRTLVQIVTSGANPGNPVTLVDASALVGSAVQLGEGAVLCARSVVTTNIRIGRHTHVNVGCAIQHDSILGDFVTLSPGVFVNGDVTIGDDVFIGTGAIITRGSSIGAGATIGAGAVVFGSVEPGAKVLGIPARAIGPGTAPR